MRPSASWRWVMLVTLALPACNEEPMGSPGGPTTIVAVAGDGVASKAGQPLSFRVAVSAGDTPEPQARVVWQVTSGEGRFQIQASTSGQVADAELMRSAVTLTGRSGIAQVSFVPTVVGVCVVTASATTDQGSAVGSVDLSTDAEGLVIAVGEVNWAASWPAGPQEATVPVGTPVDWSMYNNWGWGRTGLVRSISVPPGGETFESPVLDDGDRFTFVPSVPGTWVWEFDDGEATESATLSVD